MIFFGNNLFFILKKIYKNRTVLIIINQKTYLTTIDYLNIKKIKTKLTKTLILLLFRIHSIKKLNKKQESFQVRREDVCEQTKN